MEKAVARTCRLVSLSLSLPAPSEKSQMMLHKRSLRTNRFGRSLLGTSAQATRLVRSLALKLAFLGSHAPVSGARIFGSEKLNPARKVVPS
jgi:hypothetical protein